MLTMASANFLYAADFANGTIDVFDSAFALQPAASFPFLDPTIPTAPGNTFHPFNIQNIGGQLYVTYAKVDPMTGSMKKASAMASCAASTPTACAISRAE